MALVQSLGYNTINLTSRIITINDETGDYPNPVTGYGTPNPARNTLALFVLGLLKKTDEDIVLVAQDYAPETVTEWLFQTTEDGWHQFNLLTIPIFNVDAASNFYESGQYVWEQAGDYGLYQIDEYVEGSWTLTTENPITNNVQEIAEFLYDNNEAEYTAVFNWLILIDSLTCKSRANFKYLNLVCGCSCDSSPEIDAAKAVYDDIFQKIEGATDHFANLNYTEAQKIVEYLSDKCACVE